LRVPFDPSFDFRVARRAGLDLLPWLRRRPPASIKGLEFRRIRYLDPVMPDAQPSRQRGKRPMHGVA